MRFFRRRSNPGLVALLAIAMQAALVLAHMHVHSHVHTGARAYAGLSAAVSAGARAWGKNVALSCRAMVPTGCQPSVPHDHGNDCPMCWSVAAAGTGVMPEAPAVVLDAPRFTMLVPARAAEVRPGRALLNFQARAPPVA